MCPRNLSREYEVITGDVGLWVMCAIFELYLEPTSKLFQVDLRLVDPKLRSNRTGFLS
jgi:hypothetical protein